MFFKITFSSNKFKVPKVKVFYQFKIERAESAILNFSSL